MQAYLDSTQWIDSDAQAIQALAKTLKNDLTTDTEIARVSFEFVRDKIRHSWDAQDEVVTCKASDVLKQGTGYCYAKSHLLAALLRANHIPAGLCYQRLSLNGNGSPYCLHGFNAIYLQAFGWYRVDPRGNKPGVNAQCIPPNEQLAFQPSEALEADIQGIWPEPMPVVVQVLQNHKTCESVFAHLPDVDVWG